MFRRKQVGAHTHTETTLVSLSLWLIFTERSAVGLNGMFGLGIKVVPFIITNVECHLSS